MKETYLDIKAVLDNGYTVIIEMQVLNVEDFEKRVIYNLAKAYGNQLDVGQGYMMLKPFIALTIADFVLFEKIDKMITKFKNKKIEFRDSYTLVCGTYSCYLIGCSYRKDQRIIRQRNHLIGYTRYFASNRPSFT